MGNAYITNTVQLLDAITDSPDSKPTKKCLKCYCVPDYVALLHGQSPTSPTEQKPRKLIRNTKYTQQHNASPNDYKNQFLPIPIPIMIEESFSDGGSSLDLSIATVEFLEDHGSANSANSYDTVDINASNNDDNNSYESIDGDYKVQIQRDVIQRNALYVSREYFAEINGENKANNDNDGYVCSDRDNESDYNFMNKHREPLHHEDIESDPEVIMNLNEELRSRSGAHNGYYQKPRKMSKRKRMQRGNKRVNAILY